MMRCIIKCGRNTRGRARANSLLCPREHTLVMMMMSTYLNGTRARRRLNIYKRSFSLVFACMQQSWRRNCVFGAVFALNSLATTSWRCNFEWRRVYLHIMKLHESQPASLSLSLSFCVSLSQGLGRRRVPSA